MSENTKHTPGPWNWFTGRDVDETKPHMKFLRGSNGQGFAHTVGLLEPEDTNNANLITSAPDLFKLLQDIGNVWDDVAHGVPFRCPELTERLRELEFLPSNEEDTSVGDNPRIGSSFDDFLAEEEKEDSSPEG